MRAFLSDGIDEVMAHMTAIEAAVGLESDHFHHLRPRPDPHKGVKPMERVAARIAAALGDAGAAESYAALFHIRSTFVHGRGGLQKISSDQRILARKLARRLAAALVEASRGPERPRTEVLTELLDRGIRLVAAG